MVQNLPLDKQKPKGCEKQPRYQPQPGVSSSTYVWDAFIVGWKKVCFCPLTFNSLYPVRKLPTGFGHRKEQPSGHRQRVTLHRKVEGNIWLGGEKHSWRRLHFLHLLSVKLTHNQQRPGWTSAPFRDKETQERHQPLRGQQLAKQNHQATL